MKKKLIFSFFLALGIGFSKAQVGPYSLSPKWMIGKLSGMDFTSGAPTTLSGNPDALPGQEATSTICDPTKAIAVYCNNSNVRDVNNALTTTVNSANGQSSTAGSVSFPDPASPTNQFYVFSGNDITGGTSLGINWMLFRKGGGGTLTRIDGGPANGNNLTTASTTSEALGVGADANGGYWVVGHSQTNQYRAWHVTTTGVGAEVNSTGTANYGGGYGYLKISKCQTKIGLVSQAGTGEVYNWNKSTGKITGAPIWTGTTSWGYGCEFSPDGTKFYFSSLANTLKQVDLSTGVVTDLGFAKAGLWLGSMQLGPDDKIYVANGNSAAGEKDVGVISSPNLSGASCNYNNVGFTLTGSGGANLGLGNIAWLNPNNPVITATATATCNVYNFSFVFKTYFNDDITVNVPSVTWDWGDASSNTTNNLTPSHSFPTTGGPYTVTLTFNDATCTQSWSTTIPITITCPSPVELISFTAQGTESGVDLLWKTATELNNDYFEVQRSFDGNTYNSIGEVKGAGTSNGIHTYPFHDGEVTSGIVYYRLIQHDIDGKQSVSNTIAVRLQGSNGIPILVAPNPFSSVFVVSKMYSEAATISIYDIYGRLLEQKVTTSGEASVSLGEGLANGSYILQYSTSSGVYSLRIEKK